MTFNHLQFETDISMRPIYASSVSTIEACTYDACSPPSGLGSDVIANLIELP